MESNIVGGYSAYRKMEKNEEALFTETMKSLVGAEYLPLAVSTQVVNGTNYRFLCEAKVAISNPVLYNAVVTIYSPLQDKPVITEIKRMVIE